MIAIVIIAAIIIIAAAIFYPSAGFLHFAIGVSMTSVANIIKVALLKWAAVRAVNMGEGANVGNFVRVQYFARFFLTGAVMFLSVLISQNAIWGAIAGVFTLPVSAYSMRFFVGKDD